MRVFVYNLVDSVDCQNGPAVSPMDWPGARRNCDDRRRLHGATCGPVDDCRRQSGRPILKDDHEPASFDVLSHIGLYVVRSFGTASLHITEGFYTLGQLEYVPQGAEISDHSVCLIGFNASGWFAQNSFGPGWGQAGVFHIAYGAGGLLRDGCSAVTVK